MQEPREVVMEYIKAMGTKNYPAAQLYLAKSIKIKGPSGEAFHNAEEYINMMQKQQGRYDVKRVFADQNDVCLLYDFITEKAKTFFCSWYQVKDGKIMSIHTVFDPGVFSGEQGQKD